MPTNKQEPKDTFDQIIAKKLVGYEALPPEAAWTNIRKQIETQPPSGSLIKVWKNIFFLSAGIFVFISLALLLFFDKEKKSVVPKRRLKFGN